MNETERFGMIVGFQAVLPHFYRCTRVYKIRRYKKTRLGPAVPGFGAHNTKASSEAL